MAGIMATVSLSTILATRASFVGLMLGVPIAVISLTSIYLMFAAVLHLPPHRPRVVVGAQPAEVALTANPVAITVGQPPRRHRFPTRE